MLHLILSFFLPLASLLPLLGSADDLALFCTSWQASTGQKLGQLRWIGAAQFARDSWMNFHP